MHHTVHQSLPQGEDRQHGRGAGVRHCADARETHRHCEAQGDNTFYHRSQSKLTDELRKRIEDCWTLSELEDIYLPYKPKRRTKADIARQNGLEPLANAILLQLDKNINHTAERFVKGEVKSMEEALEGAKFIIAEAVNENENVRKSVRSVYRREAVITSKVVKAKADTEEAQKYRDYFEFSESLRRCSSHRLLAMRRGRSEERR